MKLIFDIFLYTFEMIIAFIFISYNYDKKRSKTINILFIGFFIFLAGALILKFVNNEILNLVVFFILNLLFFIICFKIKIKEAVIYSILLDAVMFGAEMIALFFFILCNEISHKCVQNKPGNLLYIDNYK